MCRAKSLKFLKKCFFREKVLLIGCLNAQIQRTKKLSISKYLMKKITNKVTPSFQKLLLVCDITTQREVKCFFL